jgi:uncharacterized Zn-binding protein involved in type VI secretion
MRPLCKLGDFTICFAVSIPCTPCPPGAIISASINTFVENRPVARLGDLASNCCGCPCPCPNIIIGGAIRTIVNNRPVAAAPAPVTFGMAFSFGRTFTGI